jgi:proteasome lid subunit RPN8/RPN11
MDARIAAAVEAARTTPQREICGVLTPDAFIRLRNIATDHREFAFDAGEYARVYASEKVEAIVHSHPGNVTPSKPDVESCNDSALPWVIVNGMGHHVWLYPSRKAAPLYGRPFQPNVFDCVTLCRDYLLETFGIDVPLPEYQFDAWKDGIDIISREFHKAGFRKVKLMDIRQHDLLVFQTYASTVPNHFAVYLGGNLILEQRRFKTSA